MSRLPLATRLACDAKSLVAALRVGSDEYPQAGQLELVGERGRLSSRAGEGPAQHTRHGLSVLSRRS